MWFMHASPAVYSLASSDLVGVERREQPSSRSTTVEAGLCRREPSPPHMRARTYVARRQVARGLGLRTRRGRRRRARQLPSFGRPTATTAAGLGRRVGARDHPTRRYATEVTARADVHPPSADDWGFREDEEDRVMWTPRSEPRKVLDGPTGTSLAWAALRYFSPARRFFSIFFGFW